MFADEFLHYPDLFPARASGEAWGDERLCLILGGRPYRVLGIDAQQRAALIDRFAELARPCDPGEAGVAEIRVFRAAPDDFVPFDFTGSEYRFDVDYGPTAVRIAGLGFMARLDWRPSGALAIWVANSADLVLDGRLENCLRLFVAYCLLESGGVLLHSSAVVLDGRAWLFPGQSGSGKSTLAGIALAEGLSVLSDDMNALVPGVAGLLAEKLPFAGDLGPTQTDADRYPVAALCRLRKGVVNAIEPLDGGEALGLLIACAPYVNADPFRANRLLDNLWEIRGCLGRAVVTFRRDGGLRSLLERHAPGIAST